MASRALPAFPELPVDPLRAAAHPMYPLGSNGAGQAILDATSLAGHLAHHPDLTDALRAYQHEAAADRAD